MKYVQITGYPRDENTAKLEVIDPDGQTKVCQGNMAYPLQISHATAAFTEDKMVVCGGYPYTDKCHIYEHGQGWSLLATMNQPRSDSASISIPGGMIVIGGWDGSNRLKTSQIVRLDGSSVTYGPEIPEPRYGHCIAQYKEDDAFFITGGRNANAADTSTVWQYEGTDNFSLKRTSTMKKTRAYHACSIFSSDQHGGRPLLVAAGSSSSPGTAGSNNCEYWDFNKPDSQWQLCSKSNVHFLCVLEYTFRNANNHKMSVMKIVLLFTYSCKKIIFGNIQVTFGTEI